jgi:hypothetical protein
MKIPRHIYEKLAKEVMEIRSLTDKRTRIIIRSIIGIDKQYEESLFKLGHNTSGYSEKAYIALKKARSLYLYFS